MEVLANMGSKPSRERPAIRPPALSISDEHRAPRPDGHPRGGRKDGPRPADSAKPKRSQIAVCEIKDNQDNILYELACPDAYDCMPMTGRSLEDKLDRFFGQDRQGETYKVCQVRTCNDQLTVFEEDDSYHLDCHVDEAGNTIKCSKYGQCEHQTSVREAMTACKISPEKTGYGRQCFREGTTCDESGEGTEIDLFGSTYRVWQCV